MFANPEIIVTRYVLRVIAEWMVIKNKIVFYGICSMNSIVSIVLEYDLRLF